MPFYPLPISDQFLNPRNIGEAKDPDAIGEAGSLDCGAVVRLSLKIDSGLQMITDAKFKATGCGYLIASASVLTETIKNLPIGRAVMLSESTITDWFGGVPDNRGHCARLCREALHAALANHHTTTREEWIGEEALICTCFGVSEKSIERAIETCSLRTIDEVTGACRAGSGCGSCRPLIEDILEDYWRTEAVEASEKEIGLR